MQSNFINIGNNLPAGYADNGKRLDNIGLSCRYHRNIQKWEKQNETELTELENAVIKANKFPEHVFDSDFCNRLDYLKSKFPKQYNYFGKKHWK